MIRAEPAIAHALFRQAMEKAGVPTPDAMVYDRRMHPGQETLTPTRSVVQLCDSIDLAETGPVMHIVPEATINAGVFDMWMRPVLDFGSVGPNRGKRDRILILPPRYKGEVPAGYLVAPPRTSQIVSITRLSVNAGLSEARACRKRGPVGQRGPVGSAGARPLPAHATGACDRRKQTCRLADAASPKPKTLVPMGDPARGGKAFRINRPAGLANWRMVHRLINSETIEDRDRIMRGSLAAIGIERGRPFAPDARMEKILVDAGQVGRLMMVNVAFSPRTVPDGVDKQLHPGTRWKNIRLKPSMTEEGPNHGQVTARTIGFHQANGAQLAWDPRDVPPGFGLR